MKAEIVRIGGDSEDNSFFDASVDIETDINFPPVQENATNKLFPEATNYTIGQRGRALFAAFDVSLSKSLRRSSPDVDSRTRNYRGCR